MRRKTVRPYGQSMNYGRLVSMIVAVAILAMLYNWLKDPAIWRMFADAKEPVEVTRANSDADEPEHVVSGPNDLDEAEVAEVQKQFEYVTDRAPLKPREMTAYWRLMDWSRTQPFAELEKRARNDVPFTQIWEQPERYRGQPIRLRLHVKRILQYDAPENPSGITTVCEAWGWTDESKSFPYVVVFPGPPPGLPIGSDVTAEMVFVGYFLKIMSYTAFDHGRGAPLFVGRARLLPNPAVALSPDSDSWTTMLIVLAGTVILAISIGLGIRSRQKSRFGPLPDSLSDLKPVDDQPSIEEASSVQSTVGAGLPFTFGAPSDHSAPSSPKHNS